MRAPHRDDVKMMLLDIIKRQNKVLRAIGEKEMKCKVCSLEQFTAVKWVLKPYKLWPLGKQSVRKQWISPEKKTTEPAMPPPTAI